MSEKKQKSRGETWDALRNMSVDDDLEAILEMSDEELDRSLAAAGGDPKAIGERGKALGDKLAERYDRLAWMGDAVRAQKEFAARRAELKARRVSMSREELEARVKSESSDPRFRESVAMLFRDHSGKPSTDEELYTLLEHIEILKEIVLAREKNK